DVVEVWDHYLKAFEKNANTKLSTKRRKRIEWALKTYGKPDALRCLDGYTLNDWTMGRCSKTNGVRYDDIELLFRDEQKFDRGLAFADSSAGSDIGSAEDFDEIHQYLEAANG
ncbi:hypothetical protein JYT86_00530, partial [bacterium AH-315-N03]|nr:hypothetical protein [bacterium AH-315-N03]